MPGRATTSYLTRKPAVLEIVTQLSETLDDVGLDTIDGAFFWRFCRPEVAAQLEAARSPETARNPAAKVTIAADLWATYRIPMGATFNHLERGVPLPYGPTELQWATDAHGAIDRATALVFSAAWASEDLERLITDAVAAHVAGEGRHEMTQPAPDKASCHLDIELVGQSVSGGGEDYVRRPYLKATVGLPLPGAGIIGRTYDELVGPKGWRAALLGGARGPHKETVLRTWGTGMLVGYGATFADAMRHVCAAGNLTEVAVQKFNENRQVLVARIPEAEPFVFQRKRAASA